MGSTFSDASVPGTDPEIEARALADAAGFRRIEGRTCCYKTRRRAVDGAKAFGIPRYAFEFEKKQPVRIPGVGYGFKTHRFIGKPVDTDCATCNWNTPSLQDNATYYIVQLTWPSESLFWVKGVFVEDIDINRVVAFVETPNDFERTGIDEEFTLHPSTTITNTEGIAEPLSYYQPGDQAAINFTFAKTCIPR